ncbi:MAG: mechanosensitive ion channel domain-containing protein [Pirellulales bacterium]
MALLLLRIPSICFLILLLSHEVGAQSAVFTTDVPDVARGQDVTPTTEDSPQDLEAKRKLIVHELRLAQRTLDAAKEASAEGVKPPEKLQHEVKLLKQLDAIVAQHEAAKTREQDLQAKLADLSGHLETIRSSGPLESKPYSFLLLDHLRDELATRHSRTEMDKVTLADSKQAVIRAKENLESEQKALRLVKSQYQATKDDNAKLQLTAAVQLAEAEVRVVGETVGLKKQEWSNSKLTQQIRAARIDLLTEKVNWISKAVVFSPSDLQDQLVTLDKRESDLKASLRAAESYLTYSEREWSRVRQELDLETEPNAALIEQVENRQLARQWHQKEVSLLNARLMRIVEDRELWTRRFKVITATATPQDLIIWVDEARLLVTQLEREKRLQQMRIDEIRREVASKEHRLQSAGDQLGDAKRWVEGQRDQLSRSIQVHDAAIASIEATLHPARKLIGEIQGDVKAWSFLEWVAGAWHYVSKAWNTEITNVDDNPLTIGKVTVAIILVFTGFIMARMLSRILGGRLHDSLSINKDRADAFQSLSFYTMIALFTLLALRFVNVPLTLFTFLGGAIAIGVGFGSQNILNNFISGLVLLVERPIRVGDLIQLEDFYGTVEHIGTRSTCVRTATNMEIIIPNSTFLQSNVQNLTLGDNKVRTSVAVGLAYGSPTRDAARLLKRAAQEHGRVLESPEPFVWFVDFGDNALNFELHFWVEVRNLSEQKRVESDMRFKIDHLFRDAGITIAYPQRDIHLDNTRPLTVQLLNEDLGKMIDGSVTKAA